MGEEEEEKKDWIWGSEERKAKSGGVRGGYLHCGIVCIDGGWKRGKVYLRGGLKSRFFYGVLVHMNRSHRVGIFKFFMSD